ncbi:putative membrane protein [Phytophthora megakarya]|uniref:Putative membrane protein n=1 Tax=Phytophthora megakarya TaxID=4795 RepID=A0A225W884_9STRA|nr:putative membrane protein [Phytophthora megakarya]
MPLLDFRWAHAVNSNVLLEAVQRQVHAAKQQEFTTEFANAIEADVIWSDVKQTPVMGHPPATDGNLTFTRFLDAMLGLATIFQGSAMPNKTPLIVKFDFKSSRAFEASSQALTKFVAQYPFTKGIFINADVLPGPANSTEVAFDAATFLKQVHEIGEYEGGKHHHKVVLSVGWTTANDNEEEIYREYSSAMVDDMLRVLKPYGDTIAVTFPIRATSMRKSWAALRPLLVPPNYGFTLWWAISQISDDELEWMFSSLELETHEDGDGNQETYAGRTFYDVKGFDSFLAKRGY